ncbi:MAG TPA: ribbon-helix-helix protein, CopG family [Woeseiaceae bacterium]|nr:ribbon-helix-helix protein, CopG family [Woeseiaceae bacterium]
MRKTLTIRTDESLRKALTRKAELEHKTVSEVVREALEDAVMERPLVEKAGSLRGRLRLGTPSAAWQLQIRERNWRR